MYLEASSIKASSVISVRFGASGDDPIWMPKTSSFGFPQSASRRPPQALAPFKTSAVGRPTNVGPFKDSDVGRPTSKRSFKAALAWPSLLGLLTTSNSITRRKILKPWAIGPSFETFSQSECTFPLVTSSSAPLADTKSEIATSLSLLQQASPTSYDTTTFADCLWVCTRSTLQSACEPPPLSSLTSCSFPIPLLVTRATSDTLGCTSHHS